MVSLGEVLMTVTLALWFVETADMPLAVDCKVLDSAGKDTLDGYDPLLPSKVGLLDTAICVGKGAPPNDPGAGGPIIPVTPVEKLGTLSELPPLVPPPVPESLPVLLLVLAAVLEPAITDEPAAIEEPRLPPPPPPQAVVMRAQIIAASRTALRDFRTPERAAPGKSICLDKQEY